MRAGLAVYNTIVIHGALLDALTTSSTSFLQQCWYAGSHQMTHLRSAVLNVTCLPALTLQLLDEPELCIFGTCLRP